MNSMNNILSVNLTSTGTYYFACQVCLQFSTSHQVPFVLFTFERQSSQHILFVKVGDHCLEDGQKLVVTVTNATAGTLSGFNVLSTA